MNVRCGILLGRANLAEPGQREECVYTYIKYVVAKSSICHLMKSEPRDDLAMARETTNPVHSDSAHP